MFRPEDIAAMMKPPIGTPVSFKGSSFFGLLDANDVTILSDHGRAEVVGATIALVVRTLDVPNIKIDDAIQVDGLAYRVRHPVREGDAALLKPLLREDA